MDITGNKTKTFGMLPRRNTSDKIETIHKCKESRENETDRANHFKNESKLKQKQKRPNFYKKESNSKNPFQNQSTAVSIKVEKVRFMLNSSKNGLNKSKNKDDNPNICLLKTFEDNATRPAQATVTNFREKRGMINETQFSLKKPLKNSLLTKHQTESFSSQGSYHPFSNKY